MLHKNSIQICQDLGNSLAERGIVLSVPTGSAFYSMINTSVQPIAALESMDSASLESMEIDPVQEVVDASHGAEHDTLQSAVVAQLVSAIRYTENHAQNVLIPAVEEALTATKTYTDTYNDNVVRGFEIVQQHYPSIYDSATLQKTIARWSNGAPEAAPVPAFKCENINLEELIRTGSTLFDSEIAEFIAAQGENFLAECWHNFRTSGYSDVLFINRQENLAVIPVYFLFALKLFQALPEGCYVENEAQFRADISRAMAALGNAIYRVQKRRAIDIEYGALVINGREALETRRIVVNAAVYAKAKVDGMTDEMLKAAVHYESDQTVTGIMSQGDRLTRLWKSYEASARMAEEESRYELTLRAMNVFLRNKIKDAAEGELPMDSESHGRQIAMAFSSIAPDLRTNHYKLIRWLVWAVLYPQSDSLAHLQRIDAIIESNPDLDVREAASLALIQYMSDWAARQIQVVRA